MELVIKLNDETYKEVIDRTEFDTLVLGIKLIEAVQKGHGRKFEEIVVEYPPADLCTYPEYKGKPYFSIKYEENGEHIIGFGTYKPEVFSKYLQEYFITPTIIEADKAEVEPNTGYWVEEIINEWSRKVFCSKCGCTPPFEHISDGDVYSSSGYGVINKTKFCPNCGIKMVEPQEKLSWLGKNCKDCGNEKCKKLGTLPKGYSCALWQPESEGIK